MAKILFLPGTSIHLEQMKKVSLFLEAKHQIFFAPFFADGLLELLRKTKIFNFIFNKTPLGNNYYQKIKRLIIKNNLKIDERSKKNFYDLVVVPTDMYLPKKILNSKIVLMQEGGLYPDGITYYLVRLKLLPRFFANTASFGLSDMYDAICVASSEYKSFFINRGVKKEKIYVTGVSEYDNFEKYKALNQKINKLPKRYVLVCLSPSWESVGFEWVELIKKGEQKAKELGIQLVIKFIQEKIRKKLTN